MSRNRCRPEPRVRSPRHHLEPPFNPVTGEIMTRYLNELGREVLSDVPKAPPIGFQPSRSIAEMIRDMVRSEKLNSELDAAGMETFEEADDFDVGDDFDPSSPYEETFEPPLPAKSSTGPAKRPVDAPTESDPPAAPSASAEGDASTAS